MISLKYRKQHTEKIYTFVSSLLNNITKDPKKSGFVVFLFHWIFIGIPTIYIIFGEINTIFFISCIIYVTIFLLHFYFGGCILTRIERKLWNTKKWYGPSTFIFIILEKVGINMNNKRMNYVYISNAILLTSIILLRLLL